MTSLAPGGASIHTLPAAVDLVLERAASRLLHTVLYILGERPLSSSGRATKTGCVDN